MSPNEKKLLSAQLKALRLHNSNAWWELKRQIFEGGSQSWYPAQGDFVPVAERLISNLDSETRQALLSERRPSLEPLSEDEETRILAAYPLMMVAEIVERARAAAYRTVNW